MLLSDMSRFSVENLLSHCVEEFREKDSFNFSLFSVLEKVWIRSGESIKNFRPKICLTVPKSFLVDTLNFSLISATGKNSCFKGVMSIFCRNFYCLILPKNFRGNPSVLCLRNLPVAKKFM